MAAKKAQSDAELKKSGIEKLTKVGKTTSEAHIISAVRQGQITKYEAAAIDPKNFKILLTPSLSSKTIDLKTGKTTIGTMKTSRGGAGSGGGFLENLK